LLRTLAIKTKTCHKWKIIVIIYKSTMRQKKTWKTKTWKTTTWKTTLWKTITCKTLWKTIWETTWKTA